MKDNYKIIERAISAQGREISLCALSTSKNLMNKTLIIGVVHGDEPQGDYIIRRYLEEYDTDELLVIPCLNPDGMAQNTRTNSNGVDINRNFPTENWELTEKDNYFGGEFPASEIETAFLINIIEKYKPQNIVTLHTPYKIVNYDGPAEELAVKISEVTGYPVEKSIGYPTPGSFGTYTGIERKIPVITLEMDEEISVDILYNSIKKVFDLLRGEIYAA